MVWMGRDARSSSTAEGTFGERLGLGVAAAAPAHDTEAAEGGNELGMVRAERGLLDAEGLPQPLFGPRQVALAGVDGPRAPSVTPTS